MKGKREPVVAADVGPAHGVRTEIAHVDLPLTGRDAELAELDAVASAAGEGNGRWVEIVAEPGSGKSRLLQEFVGRRTDLRRAPRRLPAVPARHPLLPDRSAARSGTRDPRGTPRRAGRRAAGARLDVVPRPRALDLPDRACRCSSTSSRPTRCVSSTTSSAEAGSPPSWSELLTAVLTAPVVLCVEDAHWMDDASAELLDAIGAAVGTRPWILLVTRRPGRRAGRAGPATTSPGSTSRRSTPPAPPISCGRRRSTTRCPVTWSSRWRLGRTATRCSCSSCCTRSGRDVRSTRCRPPSRR